MTDGATRLRRWALAAGCLTMSAGAAHAQQLGTIDFPSSGSAAAQAPFIRGVLLMHSFEYTDAAAAFREAQAADAGFALAYWGEALTYTHPVWNEQDSTAARAVLARLAPTPAARRARAKTHREQMYLDAAEALYGAGSKARRDTLFAAALERIVEAHPEDDEARVFHAVALLGLNQSVRDIPTYMRAGAIAEEVLRRKPDHPGAAHFVIHAFDDPIHAPLGLWAARAYSKIAPRAPHAQHMTTHIFLAMGMWDEVVSQNIVAAGPDHHGWHAGHYTLWLGYGYLQQGKWDEARRHLVHLRGNIGQQPRRGERPALVFMRAAYVIDTERWTDSVGGWSLEPIQTPAMRALDAFVTGYAALAAGDRARAERALAAIERERAAPGAANVPAGDSAAIPVFGLELRAALLTHAGQADSGIAVAREAARREDRLPLEFGPPLIVKPTHELLGELLLGAHRAAEAQRAFTRALELAPGRSRSLLGLARASAAAGDAAAARRVARALLGNWHSADAGLAARAEMERLANP